MKLLFIHNNFPAQFGGLGRWLARQGCDVAFATQCRAASDELRIVRFQDHRQASPATHHYLRGTERAVITGQSFARVALGLRRQGYTPDVVVAHSGWGAGLFAKDIWPDTRYVQYIEWYYSHPAIDLTPHQVPGPDEEERAKARIRNAPFWLDFSAADASVCPTRFQADRFPEKFRSHLSVLRDGVDTGLHSPGGRDPELLAAYGIPPAARIVTYIARGMEPMRGFPEFMRSVAELQRRRPDAHVVVIGEDRVAYGPATNGPSWKHRMLEDLSLDPDRLHFTGLVPRSKMVKFLQASDAHVYLSAPFVLSWSFLEAMSCAAPIVAADNDPVREFMRDGESGHLVDPHDIPNVVEAIEGLLDDPETSRRIGKAARAAILSECDAFDIAYPKYKAFLSSLAGH